MRNNVWSLSAVLFLLLASTGVLLVVVSFVSFGEDSFNLKGIRTIGFFCLFLGAGEYLNHPQQKTLTYNDRDNSGPAVTYHRQRNPCGLGNTLDVIALICLFLALGFFFFPYR